MLITINLLQNSKEVIQAIKFAKNKMKVISFSGFNGGRSRKMCDLNLYVKCRFIENLHHAYVDIISQFIKLRSAEIQEIRKCHFE